MKHWMFFASVCLVSIAVVAPTSARADNWRLRGYGLYLDSGDQPRVVDDLGSSASTDDSDATGFGINAEYRLGERFGVELGLARADHQGFRARTNLPGMVTTSDTMTITMATAGGNYHLTPASRVDLHLGAFVALVDYDELGFRYGQGVPLPVGYPRRIEVDVDDDVGLGVDLGLDVPIGDVWGFYGDLRYLSTTMEGSSSNARLVSTDYDPLMVGVGFSFSF